MKAIECLRKKGSSLRLRKHPSRYAKVDREVGEVNEKNSPSEARHMRVSPTGALQREDPAGEDVEDTDRSAGSHVKEKGDLSSSLTRKKGQSGRAALVQCIKCGKMVPVIRPLRNANAPYPLITGFESFSRSKVSTSPVEVRSPITAVSCVKHRKYV